MSPNILNILKNFAVDVINELADNAELENEPFDNVDTVSNCSDCNHSDHSFQRQNSTIDSDYYSEYSLDESEIDIDVDNSDFYHGFSESDEFNEPIHNKALDGTDCNPPK
jgi:hypothetical protein